MCDEARPNVEWAARRSGLSVEVIDIDEDDKLKELYDLRVPVVLGPDDSVLAEGRVDRRRLMKTLKRIS